MEKTTEKAIKTLSKPKNPELARRQLTTKEKGCARATIQPDSLRAIF